MAPAESRAGHESLQISSFLHKHLSLLKMHALHQTFSQHLRVLWDTPPPQECEKVLFMEL